MSQSILLKLIAYTLIYACLNVNLKNNPKTHNWWGDSMTNINKTKSLKDMHQNNNPWCIRDMQCNFIFYQVLVSNPITFPLGEFGSRRIFVWKTSSKILSFFVFRWVNYSYRFQLVLNVAFSRVGSWSWCLVCPSVYAFDIIFSFVSLMLLLFCITLLPF